MKTIRRFIARLLTLLRLKKREPTVTVQGGGPRDTPPPPQVED